MAFDIAGNIPTGSEVTDVVLSLNMSRSRGAGDVELHRVLSDWDEGASEYL